MEWIGGLERALATSLYPLRVPIAAGLAVAFSALVISARRRGWIRAGRRNPARSGALAVALLPIGGPVGWYLGSPLFIRSSLFEPAPRVAAPGAGGACVVAGGGRVTGATDNGAIWWPGDREAARRSSIGRLRRRGRFSLRIRAGEPDRNSARCLGRPFRGLLCSEWT